MGLVVREEEMGSLIWSVGGNGVDDCHLILFRFRSIILPLSRPANMKSMLRRMGDRRSIASFLIR